MKKSPDNHLILSIVILNYNSHELLKNCLFSIYQSTIKQSQIEILVPDNGSVDDSTSQARAVAQSNTRFFLNHKNLGFAAGNNSVIKYINPDTKYVLFLNVDTTVEKDTLQKTIDFMATHPEADAATCYVNLMLTNSLQPECHRGFPTPWNALCHFFLPFLPKLFPHTKLFNGYFLGHLDYTKIQKIDCCIGAFLLVKKSVGKTIGWWNEKYFFYGEDIDFCYQLKKHGFNLYFYPDCRINHFQGFSSGLAGGVSRQKNQSSRETKVRSAKAGTNAMRIFYHLNLIDNYPPILQWFVRRGIDLLAIYRIFKAKYL